MVKFDDISKHISEYVGRPWAFFCAIALIVGWLVTGPFFHFSDTHSLIINTITTCITFLMVFVIQNAQNRETKAIHLKLDELIRAIDKAHNELIEAEQRDTQWLEEHRITKIQQELNSHE